MTCRQFVDGLFVYYEAREASGSGAHRSALEAHAAGCRDCLNFMKTYEATLRLGSQVLASPPPADLEARIRERVMAAIWEDRRSA